MGRPLQTTYRRHDPILSNRLRLLSYNIQVGVRTERYADYLTSSWKQWWPHRDQLNNLKTIAELLRGYDFVGLQEVDSGSLRSGFVDQSAFLAQSAGFPFSFNQINRRIGRLALHSNSLLSRYTPRKISEYTLPGMPGRGAILTELATNSQPLVICVVHLALSQRARVRQLDYIGRLISGYEHVVLMGDFNCDCRSRELRNIIESQGLHGSTCDMNTFPSWRPYRKIDHILISRSLSFAAAQVHQHVGSDHLPVSVEIELPDSLIMGQAA